MKLLILIITAGFFFVLPAFADITQDAIKYSNKLIEEQNKVAEKFIALTKAFNKKDLKLVEQSLDGLKNQVASTQKNLAKMKGFEGNTRFLNAIKSLMDYYSGLCKSEFKTLLGIYKKNTITISNEDMFTVDSIQRSITENETPLVSEIDFAQKEFARKYKFLIGKNSLDEQMNELDESNKQINAAIDYNDSIVFLQSEFTKSLIVFSDNLQKNSNTDEVQEYFDNMNIVLKDCIGKMDIIRDFRGDYSFRNATMEYFTSFKKLIDGDFTVFLEIVKNKAGFTEEETKKYNELVYSLPARIDEYETKFIEAQKAFANKYNIFLYKKDK